MKNQSRTKSVLHLNCPRCGKGKLFKRKGLIVYREMFAMHEKCSECGLKYEIEPGFWIGALWASYPIVVLIEMPFLLAAVFSEGSMPWIWFSAMILTFLITWPLMVRLGRSIWIHAWVKFEG